jgi:hypothetical protein
MNVAYRCPEPDCQSRHFGLPGGTRQPCRKHQVTMVQVDMVDEDGDSTIDLASHEGKLAARPHEEIL